MTHQPRPLDEANRLAALRQYYILDTLPEQAFDDLTLLAARICNAPIACIGFIDTDRQWFKSKVGLMAQEIPRYISLCSHAIVEPDVCVIRDALADERFANNPLVTSEPNIRFYAAAQLVTPAGHAIGTICVIDHVPRELSAEQEEALRVLARQVMAQLELRLRVAEVKGSLAEQERAHEEICFQASLLNAVDEAVIATEVNGKIVYWNRFAEKMYGWSAAEVIGRNVVEIIASDISQGETAEIMSRLRRGESWSGELIVRRRDGSSFPAQITDSPVYDSNGALIGNVSISTDITERKRTEEALREAHAELERRVAQRTVELTTANALLKEEIDERKRIEQALLESNGLLRGVIEGTDDYIFAKDLNGRYLMLNSAAASFVGKPAEEIVGKNDLELFPPEIAQQFIEHDRQVIASGEMLALEERLLRRGKPQTALVVKNVYRNDQGDVIGLVGIGRDITERKQVEEKIRESERQLAVAQQIAHLGSWEHNIITDKVTWSDELYRTFGLQPQEFEASSERFIERVHPEDRGFFINVREKNSLIPEFADHEYRIIRPNGEVRILLGHGEVVTDDAGRVVKIYGTTEDITERKRVEEALRESEERFRLLVEGIKDYAIFMLDADGRIASWNEGATRLKGYLPEEAIGQHFSICCTPEDIAQGKPEQALKIAATEDRFEDECWLVRKDGSRFLASIIITPLRDEAGSLRGFVEITRDITERKRAEDMLKEQRELLRQVFDANPSVLFVKDGEERFILANKAAAQAYGTTVENLIGKTGADFTSDLELIERFHQQNQEVRETGRKLIIPEEPFTHARTGDVSWFETIKVPLFAPDGTVHQILGIATDITERVRAREMRTMLQWRLLGAQEEERRRISRELHDQIGQYLPALMLGLQALKETGPAQSSYATQLGQLQETVTRIAHDVQNLARELRPAALDEFGLATTLANYAEEWSQRHSITVDLHCTGFDGEERLPPHVEITLYRIAQEAFTNILKHAEARNVSLILKCGRRGAKMIIEDNGKGFDVEALMKTPPAQRRLGLLGIRERISLVGGSLQIESAPGAGTTIVVNAPLGAKEGGDTL